jgi:hypothetical protein
MVLIVRLAFSIQQKSGNGSVKHIPSIERQWNYRKDVSQSDKPPKLAWNSCASGKGIREEHTSPTARGLGTKTLGGHNHVTHNIREIRAASSTLLLTTMIVGRNLVSCRTTVSTSGLQRRLYAISRFPERNPGVGRTRRMFHEF